MAFLSDYHCLLSDKVLYLIISMKHIDIYNKLKGAIQNNTYPVGTRIPHTLELMDIFKVSKTTIDAAVRLLEQDGLIKRIQSKGTYVLDSLTDKINFQKNKKRIGLLFTGFLADACASSVILHILKGLERYIATHGMDTIPLARKFQTNAEYLQLIEQLHLSGVVFIDFDDPILSKELKKKKMPMVFCITPNPIIQSDQVALNYFEIALDIFRKASTLHLKNIVFIGNQSLKKSTVPEPSHYYWEIALSSQAKLLKEINFVTNYIDYGEDTSVKNQLQDIILKNQNESLFVIAFKDTLSVFKDVFETIIDKGNVTNRVLSLSNSSDPFTSEIQGMPCYRLIWDAKGIGTKAGELIVNRINHASTKIERLHFAATISPLESNL